MYDELRVIPHGQQHSDAMDEIHKVVSFRTLHIRPIVCSAGMSEVNNADYALLSSFWVKLEGRRSAI